MKKLYGSLFAKLLSVVIVCILTPILIGCICFASYAYDDEMYFSDSTVEFEQTRAAKHFVNENLAEVREYIYWNDISGLVEDEIFFEHSNFAYVIYDENGKEIVSTLKKIGGHKPEIHLPDDEGSDGYILMVENYPAEEVTVTGAHTADYYMSGYLVMPIEPNSDGYNKYVEYKFISENKDNFINIGILCFVVCALLCLYLISASGYNSDGEFELRGFNAMEMDLLLLLYGIGVYIVLEFISGIYWRYSDIVDYVAIAISFSALTAMTLVTVMNISANLKTKKCWKNTIIYQTISLFVRFIRWFTKNIGIAWNLAIVVCVYGIVVYVLGLFTLFTLPYEILSLSLFVLTVITIFAGFCIAIWFGSQLKKIKLGGEAIARGDFDYRINTRELWPMLRAHAYNLNSAAMGMSKAVEDRLKSERFKTELITNVSHDLKTPLTSIVSYVDLLKKENIENDTAKGYIEVIDRQSAKLKKLTEDLVEASKASSGTINVNKELINIGEFINQSVAEFSEKLESAEITPVITQTENEIFVCTDGRLLWRVFDNLIQNIVKYAQPGTRAYFDISENGDDAVLTVKNISREPLNMSADALMERFIRGDASRNSEGNGLGLSIAKSLTELCGGNFILTLDGDLYKVTITIPKTESPSKE